MYLDRFFNSVFIIISISDNTRVYAAGAGATAAWAPIKCKTFSRKDSMISESTEDETS